MAGESFFGQDPAHDDQRGGIPADLIPYLEAADEAEDTQAGETSDPQAEENEREAALRALVENSLLLGPDPSVLAEIEGEVDEDFADDAAEARDERASHEAALARAEEDMALDERVQEIYRSIVARAPEHDIDPTLDRVKLALDILGDPQRSYPSIHITGTNGKTSTSRMIDSLLTAFGMKTGRFTSPHLLDVRERISLEGHPITREGFVRAWEDVAPYIAMVDERSQEEGGPRLSFFEVFTIMAYAAFADYPVDAAVVEVGMGGRWDATNVIDAGVSVITPIALDHTKWLGSTIEEIAREKAGIIKPGQIVVILKQEEEVLNILLDQARSVDAIARVEGRDFEVVGRQMGVGGQMVTIRTPSAIYEDVFVPLFGQYQAHNAAAALVAVEAFMGGRGLDGRIVEQGLMNASSPGRMQVVRHSPTIIVDAAHNPAGAATLREAVESSFAFARIAGVYSAMGDKDIEGVLSEVEPFIDHLVVTQMPGERAADLARLEEIAGEVFGPDRVDVRESLADAVDRAAEIAEAGAEPADRSGVLVFGSVMLAGEMLKLAGHSPR
ncbi:folylpolyglutamate synthase/dihydrofolate synthase family protein [uncultured Actinomyces sp.]|uniref:bifunctional folylpolyglutamate synthase/dihydrofolate synthase n=1 Tax=uncultured Actinomyces sp. TaxID=249061 RepID=UPI0026309A76|nr:folylpolyglutamate synthase/dihydrofolate synthase family protein [uncultured Actinomyces sp.]